MRRNALAFCMALWAWVPSAYSQSAAADSFAGDWHPIGTPDDLTRVVMERKGAGFSVRIWSQCRPTNCYWGESAAEVDAGGNSLATKFSGWDLGAYITMTRNLRFLRTAACRSPHGIRRSLNAREVNLKAFM
jgi:hypothetical protein